MKLLLLLSISLCSCAFIRYNKCTDTAQKEFGTCLDNHHNDDLERHFCFESYWDYIHDCLEVYRHSLQGD